MIFSPHYISAWEQLLTSVISSAMYNVVSLQQQLNTILIKPTAI
jgi:hypothetical protein